MAKMIVLKSSDGETFEVEEAAALLSQTLKHMIEDNCTDAAIPLSNVTGKTLAKVIQYCNRHAVVVDEASSSSSSSKASKDNELKKFDAEFMTVDIDTLYDILMAANYLDIKSLLDLSCQTVAGIIKGKTPAQIRSALNIENDFTPEEEEEIRNRNPWAFE